MNAYQVMVNISINSNGAASGVRTINNYFQNITNNATQSAKNSANAWSTIFGANFFSNLAADMTRAMAGGFSSFVKDAVNAASAAESAFKGVESMAKNVGLNASEAKDAIKNLDLVKNGLLGTAEAATALKNLLASGFSLEQSINLIKAFGDTAAFGRQASLSFGYAISSATEGIKNQNSILVDNAGVTKNLSVIMAEYGFQMQDISDKVKGAAARQALYQGLLKETTLQQGDANKLLDTTQGRLLQMDAAWTRFLRSLGEVITQSSVVKTSLGAVVTVLDFMGKNTGAVIALTTALGLMTTAVALSSTSFVTLTAAQIANAVATSSLAGVIATAKLLMMDFSLITGVAAGELVVLTAGIGAVVIAVGALAYIIYSAVTAEKELSKVTAESIATNQKQREAIQTQIAAMDELSTTNDDLTKKKATLNQAYNTLDTAHQRAVALYDQEGVAIENNAKRTEELKNQLREYLNLKNEEAGILGRTNAANLVQTATEFATNQKALDQTRERIKLLQEYKATLDQGGSLSSADLRKVQISDSVALRASVGQQQAAINDTLARANNEFTDLSNAQGKLKETAEPLLRNQEQLNKQLGQNTDQAIESAKANNLLSVSTDEAKNSVNLLSNSMDKGVASTEAQTNAVIQQINAYAQLRGELDRIKSRKDILGDETKKLAERAAILYGNDQTKIKKFIEDQAKNTVDPQTGLSLKRIAEDERNFDVANKIAGEYFGQKAPAKVKKTKTEYENLTTSVKKLNAEVKSYQDLNSKEFKVRFNKEELERVKKDFEKIIDLRRELALPLTDKLPSTAEGAREEINLLERVKRLRDDILKIRNEERDAQDKLFLAEISANEKVVSAQTRADIAYFEGIKNRREAEAQLTADIVGEIRKRDLFANDSMKQRSLAEAEAFRDLLDEKNKETEDKIKLAAKIQLQAGANLENNETLKAVAEIAKNPAGASSPVTQRIDKSNELLTRIVNAVEKSGSEGGAGFSYSGTANYSSAPTKRAREVLNNVLNNTKFDKQIDQAASVVSKETGVDVATVRTLIKATLYRESSGRGGLVSEKNAIGYFQQLPGTSKALGVRNPNNFIDAATGAGRYLVRGISANDNSGGFLGRGLQFGSGAPEAFATYFAGESGKQRRAKTQDYVTAQTWVFNEAMRLLNGGATATATPISFATTPAGSKQTSPVTTQLSSRPRVSELPMIASLFGLSDGSQLNDKNLSKQSLDAVAKYQEAQKNFSENTKEQIIGQARLNQMEKVNFTQKQDIIVAEEKLTLLRSGDSLSAEEAINDAELKRYNSAISTINEIIDKEDYLAKLRSGDAETIKRLEEARRNQRLDEVTALEIEIKALEEKQANGGRDQELEDLKLKRERLTVINSVGEAEANLEQMRKLNADQEYRRSKREAGIKNDLYDVEKRRADLEDMRNSAVTASRRASSVANEETDLQKRLLEIEDERATSPLNQALRVRVAREEALLDIHRKDLKAQEDIARLQVEIADQTVYHADRANAKVLDFLASQKSLTDAIADLKVGAIQTTYDFIDKGLDRITSKLGKAGDLVKDFLGSFIKMSLNKVFMRMFGLDNQQTSGTGSVFGGSQSQSQAGGFDLSTLFKVLTGGGISGGNGSTPPFIPVNFNSSRQRVVSGTPALNLPYQQILQQLGFDQTTLTPQTGASGTRPRIVGTSNATSGIGNIWGNLKNVFSTKEGGLFAPRQGSKAAGIAGGIGDIAAIAGGMIGGTFGNILSMTGTGLSIGATLGGPIGAGIGAAIGFAVGVITSIFGNSKQKKADEKAKNDALNDAKKKIQDILKDVSAGNIDGATAVEQAKAVKQDYLNAVSQLKTKSVRNSAISAAGELDTLIEQVRQRGVDSDIAANRKKYQVATFATGGNINYVSTRQTGMSMKEQPYILKRDDEVVLTQRDVAALGGNDALAQAGVRGYVPTGQSIPTGVAGRSVSISSGSYSFKQPDQMFVIVADDKAADDLVRRARPGTIAKKVRVDMRRNGQSYFTK